MSDYAKVVALREAIRPLVESGVLTADERRMLQVCLLYQKYPQHTPPVYIAHVGSASQVNAAKVVAERVGEAIERGEITTYEQVAAFPGWPVGVRIEPVPLH